MPEPEEEAIKIISRIGVDYSAAIKSAKEFAASLKPLNEQLAELRKSAGSVADQIRSRLGGAFETAAAAAKAAGEAATQGATAASRMATAEGRAAEAARVTAAALQAQVAQVQATIAARGLEGTQLAQQAAQLREQVNLAAQRLAQEKTLTAEERAQLNNLKMQTEVLRQQVKTVTADLSAQKALAGAKTGAETFLQRRFGWFVAGAGFYGALNAFRQAVTTIGEIEMGMTQIARVTEDATFNFAEARDELLALGVQYGATWERVQDIALRWVQAGYNWRDAVELTRASLLALNTAELDANYATQGLIAVMAQWGLTADQLLPTIDKINKVADDFAVTSQDLVDGLARSSGAARILGLSLDQTIALLTVMREATGRTGREVGNALNSILSFMQRAKAQQVLESLGISVFADEARTQFRNVFDVFSDLAARWGSLSKDVQDALVGEAEAAGLFSEELAEALELQEEFTDAQRRDVAAATAGIYRRNYLVALLQNWSKIQSVLISAENALGYSLRENERTMQTYQMRVNSLRAAVQTLAVALGEAGLLDTLKTTVSLTTDLVEWFGRLDPTTKTLAVTFLELSAALGMVQLAFTTLGFGSVVGAVNALGKATAGAGGALAGLSKALGAVGAALRANLPVLLLLTGGTVVLGGIQAYRQQQERLDAQAEALERIQQKYRDAAEGSREWLDKLNEIAKVAPELVEAYDAEGNAIQINQERLAELRERYERLKQARMAAFGGEIVQAAREEVAQHEQAIAKHSRNISTLRELAEQYRAYTQALREGRFEGEKEQAALKELENIRADVADIVGEETEKKLEASGYAVQAVEAEIEAIRRLIEHEKEEARTVIQGKLQEARARKQAAQAALQELQTAPPPPTWRPGLAESWPEVWEYAVKPQKMREAAEEVQRWQAQIEALERSLAEFEAETRRAGQDVPKIVPKGEGKTWLESFREALERAVPPSVLRSYLDLRAALGTVEDQIAAVAREQEALDYLQEKGTVTAEDIARAQAVQAERARLLRQESELLAASNQNLTQQMAAVNARLEEAKARYAAARSEVAKREAVQAIEEAQNALATLSDEYEQNTQRIHENRMVLRQLADAWRESVKRAAEEAADWIEHATRMGVLSVEEQIAQLRRYAQAAALTARDLWRNQEELTERYLDLLQQERDKVREAYEERLALIDQWAEERTAAYERELQLLDVEAEQRERERAEREHQQKLADLAEQRRYHEVRSGRQHAEAIAEIDRQIAEENRRWEEQQAEWARQDRREELQERIREVREAAERQRAEWQKAWQKVEADFSSHNLRLLAAAAALDERWYEDAKKKAELWIKGFKEGAKPEELGGYLESLVPGAYETVRGAMPKTTDPVIERSKALLQAKREWEEAYRRGDTAGMEAAARKGAEIRASGPTLDPGNTLDADQLERAIEAAKAHEGAYVLRSGIAELLRGERVLSPQLTARFDRLAEVLQKLPDIPERIGLYANLERLLGKMPANQVNVGPVYGAQNVHLEDEVDLEAYMRALERRIRNLSVSLKR